MGLLSWIFVGLIAGWLAGRVVRGRGYGLIVDIALGIVGAFLGGYLAARLFGIEAAITGFNLTTLVTAFLGALIVVALLRIVLGKRHGR